MKEFIRKMLSEDNGNPSSMRVNMTYINLQWSLAITFVLVWCAIYHPDVIVTLVSMILAALLAVLGIKRWQKSIEKPSSESTDPSAKNS